MSRPITHHRQALLGHETGKLLGLAPAVESPYARLADRWGMGAARLEELAGRGAGELAAAMDAHRRSRVHLFLISGMRIPRGMGDNPPPIAAATPTILGCLAGRLIIPKIMADARVEALRRKLAAAREAARDRNLSAIGRILAYARVDALAALIRSLALVARELVAELIGPAVLSAGGRTGLHVPLN